MLTTIVFLFGNVLFIKFQKLAKSVHFCLVHFHGTFFPLLLFQLLFHSILFKQISKTLFTLGRSFASRFFFRPRKFIVWGRFLNWGRQRFPWRGWAGIYLVSTSSVWINCHWFHTRCCAKNIAQLFKIRVFLSFPDMLLRSTVLV